MSWLFWVLVVVLMIFGIMGFRKGLLKTLLSMISTIAVILIIAWLTPHIGDYIRENTSMMEMMQERMESTIFAEIDTTIEIPVAMQVQFIEELPLPQIMKDILIENNNSEVYQEFDVSSFVEYLSEYVARGLINGIAFVIALIATVIIMRIIVVAITILTELPLIGTLDRLGGFAIGIVHGGFWIAIFFLIVVLISDTGIGKMLMETIKSDSMLAWVYDKNALVQIIMRIIG